MQLPYKDTKEGEDDAPDGEPISMSLDDVLELIPVGNYHYRLLIICGMSFMSDAMVCSNYFTHTLLFLSYLTENCA